MARTQGNSAAAGAAPLKSKKPRPTASENAKALFHNRLRSLHCIDHHVIPELSDEEWARFQANPPCYFIQCADDQADVIWRELEKRQAEKVTEEFLDRSATCAIQALMSLEATAKMLERWGPECFPENEKGQVHFARALMDAAAESIREAFANAIKQVETPRVQSVIAKAGELAQAALGNGGV